MYIGTIVEDTLNSNCSFLKNEHGLSLYIKYNNKNILFDSGPSDVLISNALKMNLNISDIDYLIIPHGHFDHGGGIIPFLEHNHKAKVFMQKYSNRNYYFEDKKEKEFIGLDPLIFKNYSDRIVFTDKSIINICENVFLIPNIEVKKELTSNNKAILIKQNDNTFIQDNFEHEQAMVIKDNDKYYLFSGCSHNGIINIGDTVKKALKIDKIDFFIGGLHLVDDPILKTSIKTSDLDDVANYLKNNIGMTYTCHCTGDPAYNYLKNN